MINLLEIPHYADRRLAYIIFDIIEICKEKFDKSYIRNVILPLIVGMK